jgi:nucleotidyltransferase substrate binding protein (TIGR01987 family)
MERLKERIEVARKALVRLEELVAIAKPTAVERDAAIQRFEYTFEAVWKVSERYLAVREGMTVRSPKACVRAAREARLLTDEQTVTALEMVDDRNETVHTYNEAVAARIFGSLLRYSELLRAWLDAMTARTG